MGRHAVLVAGVVAAIAIASAAQRSGTPERSLTLEETEALVKAHAAGTVKSPSADVTVTVSTAKRFTASELACQSADADDVPTEDGFAITTKIGRTQMEYRTDRSGNIRRCRVVAPINE
jgi:hypothetical protein